MLHGCDWNFILRRSVTVVQFLPIRARRSITLRQCPSPQKTHTLEIGFWWYFRIQAVHLLTACKFTEWHVWGEAYSYSQNNALKNPSSSIMLSVGGGAGFIVHIVRNHRRRVVLWLTEIREHRFTDYTHNTYQGWETLKDVPSTCHLFSSYSDSPEPF